MKEIQVTKKIKLALSQHFTRKGTVHNVTGDLARVPLSVRESCYEFWKRRRDAQEMRSLEAREPQYD